MSERGTESTTSQDSNSGRPKCCCTTCLFVVLGVLVIMKVMGHKDIIPSNFCYTVVNI